MRLLAQTRNLEIPGSCFARPGMTGSALSLLDDETLHGAAEIAVLVRQPRRGEARAVGADQGFAIEQNPFSHRLADQNRTVEGRGRPAFAFDQEFDQEQAAEGDESGR